MKRPIFAVLIAGLALLLTTAGGASAGSDPENPWWVIAGGGGSASGGNITLDDTLGEAIIGASAGDGVALDAGYWQQLYGPAAVTGLRAIVVIETSQRKVRLEWTAVGSDTVGHTIAGVTYNVYRDQNLPYFPPGASSATGLTSPTWTDPDATVLTLPAHGTYYVVEAVYNGLTAAPSNRVGACVFALVPGS